MNAIDQPITIYLIDFWNFMPLKTLNVIKTATSAITSTRANPINTPTPAVSFSIITSSKSITQ